MKYICLLFCSVIFFSCSSAKRAKLFDEVKNIQASSTKKELSHFRNIWSKNTDPVYNSGNLPVALNSPLIHEDILYIGHNSGHMKAYELENGREIWSKEDKGAYHSQPIIFGENLIYGNVEGRVFARHYLTGEEKYIVDLGASIESKPLLYQGRLFVHTRSHKLFGLDAETGKILWAYKRSVPLLTTLQRASDPVIYKNKIYLGFADGSVCAFSMEEGVLLWERKISIGEKFIDVDMSPFIHEDKLYIGSLSGNLHVLNPQTGRVIKIYQDSVTRSPKKLDVFIVYPTTEGEVVFLDSEGKESKRKKLSYDALSGVEKWKENFVATDVKGNIFLLNSNLDVLETKQLGHDNSAVFGRLQVEDDYLAIFSSRNRLYVFN